MKHAGALWLAALIGSLAATAGNGAATRPAPEPTAVKLALNGSHQDTIWPTGNVDVYELTFPGPGIFRFNVLKIPAEIRDGDGVFELETRLTGPGVDKAAATRKDALSYNSDPFAVVAGTYRLTIKDFFDDNSSLDPYTVQTIYTEVADATEPNDTLASATPLAFGRPERGYLLPGSDVDYYTFSLAKRAPVALTVSDIPPEVRNGRGLQALYLGVLDSQGRAIKEFISHAGEETLEAGPLDLEPGTYHLCVRDFNGNNFSAAPYTVLLHAPAPKPVLTKAEEDLLSAVAAQFEKRDGLDSEEEAVLARLRAYLEAN